MKTVKDYYNSTASGWSDEYYDEKLNRDVLKKFVDCFVDAGTTNPKVLDLGCGEGYNAKYLSEIGAKVVGVDVSENLIDIAKKQEINAKFFVGDISASLENLGKFDGVLCLDTIMHIGIEKLKETFENVAKVLNKGGLLVLSSFDGVGKNIKKSVAKIKEDNFDKNFNNYNAETICSLAYPSLKLVDTWKFDDFEEGWRYYIFEKTDKI